MHNLYKDKSQAGSIENYTHFWLHFFFFIFFIVHIYQTCVPDFLQNATSIKHSQVARVEPLLTQVLVPQVFHLDACSLTP